MYLRAVYANAAFSLGVPRKTLARGGIAKGLDPVYEKPLVLRILPKQAHKHDSRFAGCPGRSGCLKECRAKFSSHSMSSSSSSSHRTTKDGSNVQQSINDTKEIGLKALIMGVGFHSRPGVS